MGLERSRVDIAGAEPFWRSFNLALGGCRSGIARLDVERERRTERLRAERCQNRFQVGMLAGRLNALPTAQYRAPLMGGTLLTQVLGTNDRYRARSRRCDNARLAPNKIALPRIGSQRHHEHYDRPAKPLILGEHRVGWNNSNWMLGGCEQQNRRMRAGLHGRVPGNADARILLPAPSR